MQNTQTRPHDRPTVICHILASVDGKISGRFFADPATGAALRAYAALRAAERLGDPEARRTAEALGIHFIDGIELDSKYPGIGGRFHILGYGIDSAHEELKGCCSGYAQQRLERAGRILTYLEKKGISIP